MKSLSVFRSAFNSVKKRYSLLTITALVMVSGVFMYYFFFLSARSEDLDQRQYRVLNRIENQLRVNLEGYKNLAVGQSKAVVTDIYNELRGEYGSDFKLLEIPEDQLNDSLTVRTKNVSFIRKAKLGSGNLVMVEGHLDKDVEMELTNSLVTSQHDKVDSLFSISVILPRVLGQIEMPRPVHFDYVLSVGALIRPLLRHDMFDHFMILKEDTIIYSTVSSGAKEFHCDTVAGEIYSADSKTGKTRHVIINGQDFRVYQVGFSTESESGWTVVGLRSAESFATERRTVPRPYLFGIFILAVFIVLSVPFIKSMIMSRTERLGTTDVIFSAISLALFTSVISILFIDGYLRFDLDETEQETQLISLSGVVEEHLASEINFVTQELRAYSENIILHDQNERRAERLKALQYNDGLQNERYRSDSVAFNSITRRDSMRYATIRKAIAHIDSVEYVVKHYDGFSNLFLVNASGNTVHDYNDSTLMFAVSNRRYVKAIRNGECMQMPGVDYPMFLDAIISWREQQFRAAVSIPVSDSSEPDYTVAVMTMRLRSVAQPILPLGTGFCIFDRSGTVMFHSDSTKSLNENILEECGNSVDLEAAIVGRTEAVLNVEYSGTRCKMYVRPLKNLPYFIGTFAQRAPIDAVHGQVFGMAFILQILLFSFYVGVILLGLILMRRKSRLHSTMFDLSAFTPDVSGTERYVGALIFNVLHGVLLLSTACLLQGSLTVILLFFISAPYSIFLNMVQLSNYKLKDFVDGDHRKLFWLYVAAIVIANGIAWNYVSNWWVLPLVQLAMIGIFMIVENRSYSKRIAGVFHFVEVRMNYRRAYSLLIFVLVVLTCVLPATAFAILTFNKEKEIEIKTVQLHVMENLAAIDYSSALSGDSLMKLSEYFNPFYNTKLSDSVPFCEEPREYVNHYDRFSLHMRELIQNSGEERFNRMAFGAHDTLWRWCYSGGDQLVMTGKNSLCKPDYHYRLVSDVPLFKMPYSIREETWRTLRFWLCMTLAIVILYVVLRFFTGKIFAHEKYSRTRSLRFDQDFFENTDPGYKAFVTGMPSAGKSAYFTDLCRGKVNVYRIDFVQENNEEWQKQIDAAKKPGKGIVIIDHFEHNILDKDLNKVKLNLIEQLVASRDKKVVIISSIQPGVFTNILEEDDVDAKLNSESDKAYERWNRVLAAFYDFIFPLQGYYRGAHKLSIEYASRLDAGEELAVPKKLVDLVESECDHGLFLRAIGIELFEELHKRKEIHVMMDDTEKWKEREDLIIRVQKLADNYYRSLWNHLAVEEQFVLYDLAQDGLVNPKNLDIVETLVDKGLVLYTNKLRIMNRSFRNFILCVVGPTDLGKLDQKVRNSGAWSKLKPALVLIVVSLFLFVMKSDRSQLFGYFTAFSAIIPVVVALFGFFGNANKKE